MLDDIDPCVSVGGAHDFVKPRIQIGNVDLVTSNDTLVVSAQFAVAGPFADLDPRITGARVVLAKQAGGNVVDVSLPAAAYGGKGTRGWSTNAKRTTWTYQDTTAAPLAGITSVAVVDQSKQSPNRVSLKVTGIPA